MSDESQDLLFKAVMIAFVIAVILAVIYGSHHQPKICSTDEVHNVKSCETYPKENY